MVTTRKTAGRRTAPKKRAGGITKAKVKRVAREATASLDVAAHDARLALGRTTRKLKRTARKLDAADRGGGGRRCARAAGCASDARAASARSRALS